MTHGITSINCNPYKWRTYRQSAASSPDEDKEQAGSSYLEVTFIASTRTRTAGECQSRANIAAGGHALSRTEHNHLLSTAVSRLRKSGWQSGLRPRTYWEIGSYPGENSGRETHEAGCDERDAAQGKKRRPVKYAKQTSHTRFWPSPQGALPSGESYVSCGRDVQINPVAVQATLTLSAVSMHVRVFPIKGRRSGARPMWLATPRRPSCRWTSRMLAASSTSASPHFFD